MATQHATHIHTVTSRTGCYAAAPPSCGGVDLTEYTHGKKKASLSSAACQVAQVRQVLVLVGHGPTSGVLAGEAAGTAREVLVAIVLVAIVLVAIVLVGNETQPGSNQTGAETPGADRVAPLLRTPARHPAALPASRRDSK